MCWTTQGGEKQPGHMFGRGGKVKLSKGGLLCTPLLCYTPCIFIIFGRFGHVQTAAFELFSAMLAMFRRLHLYYSCHVGHVQAAAF